jgi:pSer/pThr/pTyr-binding forkhead associated (FHA) protein
MAQTYQPGVTPHQPRHEGEEPKSSGFYQKGGPVEGGWGFVLPREDGRIEIVPARNAAVIGSDEGADVRIVGPDVAPRHARVEVRADGVYLEDLESPGGTFVGGVRARRIGVAHGDVVRFGNQLAVFAERDSPTTRKIDLATPLVLGRATSPLSSSRRSTTPAPGARSRSRGPSVGKRTLAELAARERQSNGQVVTINGKGTPADSVAARAQQPATWILLNAEHLPRPLQVEIGQILNRIPEVVAIGTLETPSIARRPMGWWRPVSGALFNGRRAWAVPSLSARREVIPASCGGSPRSSTSMPHGCRWSSSSASLGPVAGRESRDRDVLRDAAGQADGMLDASSIQRPLTRPPSAYPSLPAADDPARARAPRSTLSPRPTAPSHPPRGPSMSRQAVYREAQRLEARARPSPGTPAHA